MARFQIVRRFVILFAAFGVLTATASGAEEKASAKIDPKAQEVVRRLSDYIHGLKSFRVNMALSMKTSAPGMKQEVVSAYIFAVRRPDRLAMVLKDSVMGITIVCDGKKLYSYAPTEGHYRVVDAPKGLADAVPAGSMIGPPAFGSPTFASEIVHALLVDKPYDALMQEVSAARYLGAEDLGGVRCDRVEFARGDWSWFLWVQTGDKPLIRRIAPDMAQQVARVAQGMPGIKNELKLDAAITFDNWAVDATLPDDLFKFTPPQGVTVAEADAGKEGEGASSLLGKPAPNVKLDLLDGGKFDLAAYKDKSIVILDLWATWCGPCQMTMPVLIDIAKEYKDKGVLLITVDLQEPAEKVRDFLKLKKWPITVAMDPTAATGETYRAEGIPLTVIVAKDGTIQAVHEGFDPDMKTMIKKDLDTLLGGKALVPKK